MFDYDNKRDLNLLNTRDPFQRFFSSNLKNVSQFSDYHPYDFRRMDQVTTAEHHVASMDLSYEEGLTEIDAFYTTLEESPTDNEAFAVVDALQAAKHGETSTQTQEQSVDNATSSKHANLDTIITSETHDNEDEFATLMEDIDRVTAYDVQSEVTNSERHFMEQDRTDTSQRPASTTSNPGNSISDIPNNTSISNEKSLPALQTQAHQESLPSPAKTIVPDMQADHRSSKPPSLQDGLILPLRQQPADQTKDMVPNISPEQPSNGSKNSLYVEMRTEEDKSSERRHSTKLGAAEPPVTTKISLFNQDTEEEVDAPSSPVSLNTLLKDAAKTKEERTDAKTVPNQDSQTLANSPPGLKSLDSGGREAFEPSADPVSKPKGKKGRALRSQTVKSLKSEGGTVPESSLDTISRAEEKPASKNSKASKARTYETGKLSEIPAMDEPPKQPPRTRKQKKEAEPTAPAASSNEPVAPQRSNKRRHPPQEDTSGKPNLPKRQRFGLGRNELQGLLDRNNSEGDSRRARQTRAQKEEEAKKQPNAGAAAKARHKLKGVS